MNHWLQGSIPSNIVDNLRDCKAITLRSGKELKDTKESEKN